MRAALCLVLIVAANALLGACDVERSSGDREIITVATDATFPPFHYIEGGGAVTGFDVELAGELVRRSGFEPRVTVVPYEELFGGLLAGDYDLIAATTGITEDRQRSYLFTNPYFDTCQVALVRTGEGEPESLADLAGLKVGAAGAGTSVAALSALPQAVPVLLSEREATEDTIMEDGSVPVLASREIDALVVDELDAVDAARASNGYLRVLAEPVALEQYGFVMAPGSAELKRALDDALAGIRADGTYDRLLDRYELRRGEDWPVELPR